MKITNLQCAYTNVQYKLEITNGTAHHDIWQVYPNVSGQQFTGKSVE